MIKSIHIKNFQSHKDTELELHPGLNVIYGPSDSGKSAIIRAIRWVIKNKPKGNSIVRKGTRAASVSLYTPNGDFVQHNRSKSVSSYRVNDIDFPQMGKDVPQEVLNLFPFVDENIQYQLDMPFLVMESPGKIADLFNDVTNLTKADMIGRELDRRRKECNRKYSEKQEEIKNIKEQLDNPKFKILNRLSKLVDKVDLLQIKRGKLQQRLDLIESLVAQYNRLQIKLDKIDKILTKAEGFNNKLNKLVITNNKMKNIMCVVDIMDVLESDIRFIDNTTKHKERLKGLLDKIDSLKEEIREKSEKSGLINDVTDDIIEAEAKIDLLQNDLKESKKEYNNVLSRITHCPRCGAKITTEEQREKILNG